MPRARRYFESKCVYEICFRARSTLPLAANRLMRFLLACILARVQRDMKVILCHDIWNGSHAHIIVVCLDSDKMKQFYGEIQKQITDVIKRLFGLDHLQIWEGHPMVAKLDDAETAGERIAYIYANPGQDNLEDTIEKYPGYSSWSDYEKCGNKLEAVTRKSYPWVRLPTIPELPSYELTEQKYGNVIRLLESTNKKRHVLERHPNYWFKSFGITKAGEIAEFNKRIVGGLREKEERAREKRERSGKKVMGAAKLKSQPILKPHQPKKYDRKIFIMSTCKESRISFINFFHNFCDRCRECYLRWKAGDYSVEWPLGAFKPPFPPLCNVIPGND